jgi:L-malate glycosyltransferase
MPRSKSQKIQNTPREARNPRLLVIGPTYQIAVNRRKLWALAGYFDVTCATSMFQGKILGDDLIEDYRESTESEPFITYRFEECLKRKGWTFYYRNLKWLFKKQKFDLILVESEPWSLMKWQAWLLAKRYQKNAVFGEFSWENLEKPGVKGFLLSFIYRLSIISDHFIIAGNRAAAALFEKFGCPQEKILVAPQLGVDTRMFHPVSMENKNTLRRRFRLPDAGFLVGFCGRLTPEKGVMELLHAVKKVREQRPNVFLIFMGSGPLAEELSVNGSYVLPSRPHYEVPEFLTMLDLLVLPSKPMRSRGKVWEEQFGHVLIEAMACGVLAIGSDSGAIPEILEHPKTIFRHSDVEALYQVLIQLIENETIRLEVKAFQTHRVHQKFTHEMVAKIYADFLQHPGLPAQGSFKQTSDGSGL